MTAIINIWQDIAFKTAVSYLSTNLSETFGDDVDIRYIGTKQLEDDQTWDPSKVLMMIIPPVMGEKCNYEEAFTPSVFQKKHDYIKNGGVTFETCAPAYQAFSTFKFTSPTTGEEFKKTSSTPLIKGTAHGPVKGLGHSIDAENRYSDCIVTPIEYKRNNTLIQFGCCYGNGCAFEIDEPEIEIWAQYAHNNQQLPAMVKKSIGNGFTVLSGVVPQYRHEEKTIPALEHLNNALKPHETKRRSFIQSIFGEVARHGVQRGIITDTPRHLKTSLAHIGNITPL